METIIRNPGLQHLAQEVFWNLNVEELRICAQITQSCKQILKNPIFYLRKFNGLSKKNQKDRINTIQSVKNPEKGIAIISYLQWNLKKDAFVDLPCYSRPAVQDDFNRRIKKICMKEELSDEDMEIVKILAPLTDNLNEYGITPINWAAYNGHSEIVKILAPLTNIPNAPSCDGSTPIFWAACNGHTQIVQILAPLTDNPNAPDNYGETPIYVATINGHTEIVKILASFTDNPNNARNKYGKTPIHVANSWLHLDGSKC